MTRSKVLREAVSYWKQHFKGAGALELSESLGLPHGRVVAILRNLESRGLGWCRPIDAGQRMILELDGDAGVRVRSEPCPPSVIFFPGHEALLEEFRRAGVDYGPYSNLLHLGESQVALRYFGAPVLADYFAQQEKYRCEDQANWGYVDTKDQYYLSLTEAEQHRWGVSVRYGKRRLAGGGMAVAAILIDLARLHPAEQRRWECYELKAPSFDREDPGFRDFVRQEFEGERVDHGDPIQGVYDAIRGANEAAAPCKLFRREQANPHLVYPVFNNRKAYSAAHKELQKIVGRDNLDVKALRCLLRRLTPGIDLPSDEGAWALLKRVVAVLLPEDHKAVLAPLERVFSARSLDTHEIDPLGLDPADFHERFARDCESVSAAVTAISDRLRQILHTPAV
jgi:hypothetical protein